MLAPLLLTLIVGLPPQDRLATMPGYERYDRIRREAGGSVVRGTLQVQWAEDSKTFTYSLDSKKFRYDIAARKAVEIEGVDKVSALGNEEKAISFFGPLLRQQPERGRQFGIVRSPDSKFTAVYKDRNVWLRPTSGDDIQISTEGNTEKRIKFGQASWVYGEELGVRNAMWWSPDSKKLAFYRFDESPVKDYYLTLDERQIRNRLDIEAYPKAGEPNPEVDLFVYDLDSKKTTKLNAHADLGAGAEVGYYLYDVRWSSDGKELFFNRTNRKQNVMEFCAADPDSGTCRVVVRESWPQSWVENHPPIQYLEEQSGKPRRFLWLSERNGFQNIYLGDLSGTALKPITQHNFEVARILRVDEKAGQLYYVARSAPNPYYFQLHRVGLDGKGDFRMSDPTWHHSIDLAPDEKHFIDTIERLDEPPTARLCDASGNVLETLKKSDLAKFDALSLKRAEQLVFKAADGVTELHGTLFKPSNFDPTKKYPLVVSTYAGPESGGSAEDFAMPPAITEMGFLYAQFEGRGTNGRGKAFKDAVYGKLCDVEIADQAAGVKYLRERSYVDGSNVGIYGTSYGGTTSIMAILRHPDVFSAAVASSAVTDWRNYDTIYTERYMGLPDEKENKKGYDETAMKYVGNLKGKLMLYYGTADNNVHPTNTLQLIAALARAGKSYDLQVGPDAGHSGVNQTRMWEYFVDHLRSYVKTSGPILNRAAPQLTVAARIHILLRIRTSG